MQKPEPFWPAAPSFKPQPTEPITVEHPLYHGHAWQVRLPCLVVIDAPHTLLPWEYGKHIGLDWSKGKAVREPPVRGGTPRILASQREFKVRIFIGNDPPDTIKEFFVARVRFCKRWPTNTYGGILGRRDCVNRFVVRIDRRARTTMMTPKAGALKDFQRFVEP